MYTVILPLEDGCLTLRLSEIDHAIPMFYLTASTLFFDKYTSYSKSRIISMNNLIPPQETEKQQRASETFSAVELEYRPLGYPAIATTLQYCLEREADWARG